MVDLNIGNFLTIGLISVASWAAVQWILAQFNIQLPWMQ